MHFAAGLLFFISSSIAGPISAPSDAAPQTIVASEPVSFNNWNNVSSLGGFDDFRGADNFDGSSNPQVVIVQQQQETVCRSVAVETIQQKLVVLQETAKRIILEQLCEVETQTVVLQQFQSGLQVFQKDIRREITGRQVGFDQQVASQVIKIFNADGTLIDGDLGFNGRDVGKNTVVVQGDNWNNDKIDIVRKAEEDARKSARASAEKGKGDNSTVVEDNGNGNNSTASDSGSDKKERRWWLY